MFDCRGGLELMYLKHMLTVISLRSETLWLLLSWFECLSMKGQRV